MSEFAGSEETELNGFTDAETDAVDGSPAILPSLSKNTFSRALVGFSVALVPHARMVGLSGLRDYLPRTADFYELFAFSKRELRRLVAR